MSSALVARAFVYLGMGLIAAFATYTLYTNATADRFSTKDLFGALAMLGLVLVLAGTVLRQRRS